MTTSISNFGMNQSANNTIFNAFKNVVIIIILCFACSDGFAQVKMEKGLFLDKRMKDVGKIKSLDKMLSKKSLCPDLAVMPIQVKSVDSRSVRARGRTKKNGTIITATIKNIGGLDYVSSENQQAILLYINNRLVKRRSFANLAKGKQIKVNHIYAGTSQPVVKVIISYDPDIRMDSNDQNDECTYANNERTLDMARIR